MRVLPDGCADLIIDRASSGHSGVRVVGTMRQARVLPAGAQHDLVGVRFVPGGARALLGLPMEAFVDSSTSLFELMAEGEIAEGMLARGSEDGLLGGIEQYLLGKRARVVAEDRRGVRFAVACMASTHDSVASLAQGLGVSRQHLRRRVLEATGVGPKQLHRIGRLRRVVESIAQGRRPDAAIAVDAGYCDQSHMVNEFRSLSGTTPSAYARERAAR